MRFNHKTLLGTALLLALAPIASATTWYVNGVSGSDSNNCRLSTSACRTIGHAISLAASGDTVIIAAATYSENLTINISLNVFGSSASTTIIDGGLRGAVVTVSNATAHVTLSNLTLRNGKNTNGGGIKNSGTLTLTSSTVRGNSAPIPCRIIVIGGAPHILCLGAAAGGGINNSGTLIISNSIISGNRAGGFCNETNPRGVCAALGGGIYNAGMLLMIQNSTLTGNSVSTTCLLYLCHTVGMGGAVDSIGKVTLSNTTVEGHSASCPGGCSGSGAIVNSLGNLAMNNSTVSGNPAGGIFNRGTATLQNSIIANNIGNNCGGTITSYGYNLSSDGTCSLNGPGDMKNIDPLLGPLQNNGGPTQTMALLPGSPAIDAGNPSGCTDGQGHLLKTDQRGVPRPDKEDVAGCDMGAYERQSD